MCEYALEIAEKEAERRYEKEVKRLICFIADEIVESAEEYDE